MQLTDAMHGLGGCDSDHKAGHHNHGPHLSPSWRPGGCHHAVPGPRSLRRPQGTVPPAPSSSWGLQASPGGWPPPSHLCLRLHVASPLCLCPSSSVPDKDTVVGFRAPLTQDDLLSDPSLSPIRTDPVFRQGPVLRIWGLGRGRVLLGGPSVPTRSGVSLEFRTVASPPFCQVEGQFWCP